MLDFVPDNQGIIRILARQVEGPYRFAHDALKPYVVLGPSSAHATITVHQGQGLQLREPQPRRLTGLDETLILAVMLQGAEGVTLVEPVLRPHPLLLPVMPQPSLQPSVVQALAMPAVAWSLDVFAILQQREQIQPDLGDYVVIPHADLPARALLPAWVVRSAEVAEVHVIKPRLGEDRRLDVSDLVTSEKS